MKLKIIGGGNKESTLISTSLAAYCQRIVVEFSENFHIKICNIFSIVIIESVIDVYAVIS